MVLIVGVLAVALYGNGTHHLVANEDGHAEKRLCILFVGIV